MQSVKKELSKNHLIKRERTLSRIEELNPYTLVIFELNILIDSGKFNDISIDEVYDWINRKEILRSLHQRTNGEFQLAIFTEEGPYENFYETYHDHMYSLMNPYSGEHSRKWGVNNLGLCLLLAWTNELIKSGSGWEPNEDYAR